MDIHLHLHLHSPHPFYFHDSVVTEGLVKFYFIDSALYLHAVSCPF